jgi:hypothetical protein
MPPDDLAPLIAAVLDRGRYRRPSVLAPDPDAADHVLAAILDAPGGLVQLPPPVAAAAAAVWVAKGLVQMLDYPSGTVATLTPWGAEQLGLRLDDEGRWRNRAAPLWDAHDPPPRQPRERGVGGLGDRAPVDPNLGPLEWLIFAEGLLRDDTGVCGRLTIRALHEGPPRKRRKGKRKRAKRRAA